MAAEIDVALEALAAAEECSDEKGESLKYFQALHLRRYNPAVAQWALSARVASAAAQLLGSDVRLYQDGFFRKGDSEGSSIEILNDSTNIHRELDLIPVETDNYVTAWCPLRPIDTARNDSALFFFPRTHRCAVPVFALSHSLFLCMCVSVRACVSRVCVTMFCLCVYVHVLTGAGRAAPLGASCNRHLSFSRSFEDTFIHMSDNVKHLIGWTKRRFEKRRKVLAGEATDEGEGEENEEGEEAKALSEFKRSCEKENIEEFSYLW